MSTRARIIFTTLTVVASIVTIAAFFIEFQPLWKHRVETITSTQGFQIDAIYDSRGHIIHISDEFSYRFSIPIEVKGTTDLSTERVWVVLRDEFGNYYVQNPPVSIKNGNWGATNIRPLGGIKQIHWIKVDEQGDRLLQYKVDNSQWGGFKPLPVDATVLATIDLI